MSEFTCIIRPSVDYCTVCGGNIYQMDGMTAKQLEAQEREEREEIEEEQE